MTKEELERIKEAYYSGLKVQIWFNGHWENFDARDYSMYPDPFSENRQYRVVGSTYADIAEKRIAELEERVQYELSINDQKQNEINLKYRELNDANEKVVYLACHLNKAIEIIEELKDEVKCYFENTMFDVDYSILNKANDFLKEVK